MRQLFHSICRKSLFIGPFFVVTQDAQSSVLILYQKTYVRLMGILETQESWSTQAFIQFSAWLRVLRDKQKKEAVKFQESVCKFPQNHFNDRAIYLSFAMPGIPESRTLWFSISRK